MRSRSLRRGLEKNLRRILARYLALAWTLPFNWVKSFTPMLRAVAGVTCISPVAPAAPRAFGFRVDSLKASAARFSQSKSC